MIQTSRYQYNALEQLVSRSTTALGGPKGTVHYIYALDGSLLAEADGATGQIQREYVWLPAEETSVPLPLALITGVNTATPSLLMVHADHLNRPIRLTDATRATVWQASYRPFGEVDSIQGKLEQNLRFPGQYFLMETGLSYNWHRFYDPATGRYTQPDPLRFVDGPSVYGYAGASPLTNFDPEGYMGHGPGSGPYSPGTGPGTVPGAGSIGAIGDFLRNFGDMREANRIGADKYFHCKANCEAAQRGPEGAGMACLISNLREWADRNIKEDPPSASAADQVANEYGRSHAGSPSGKCEAICSLFRPSGLESKY